MSHARYNASPTVAVAIVVPVLLSSLLAMYSHTGSAFGQVIVKLTWRDRGPDQEGGSVLSTARLALCLRCLG